MEGGELRTSKSQSRKQRPDTVLAGHAVYVISCRWYPPVPFGAHCDIREEIGGSARIIVNSRKNINQYFRKRVLRKRYLPHTERIMQESLGKFGGN